MPERSGTQVLERGVVLLREISEQNHQGSKLVDLVARTGLDRSTVHRILKCLVTEQLLTFDSSSKRYRLGPLAFYMGLMRSMEGNLRDAAAPVLSQIAGETGDTVFLMVKVGVEAICADRREGSYPIKTLVVDVGTRRPLGIGAGGTAILASLSDDDIETAMAMNASRIAQFPAISQDSVRDAVASTKKNGYALTDVPTLTGVKAIGYPICPRGRQAVAAFSIAAVAPRISPQRTAFLLSVLKNAANELVSTLNT